MDRDRQMQPSIETSRSTNSAAFVDWQDKFNKQVQLSQNDAIVIEKGEKMRRELMEELDGLDQELKDNKKLYDIDLKSLREQVEKLTVENKGLIDDKTKLQDAKRELQQQERILTDDVTKLVGKNDQLTSKVDDLQAQLDKMRTSRMAEANRLMKLNEKNSWLSEQMRQLNLLLNAMKTRNPLEARNVYSIQCTPAPK